MTSKPDRNPEHSLARKKKNTIKAVTVDPLFILVFPNISRTFPQVFQSSTPLQKLTIQIAIYLEQRTKMPPSLISCAKYDSILNCSSFPLAFDFRQV